MTYTPQEISDALEFVERYLDSIDTAVAINSSDTPIDTQITRGKTIIEEHHGNLEQIAEMGRYARSMIDSRAPSLDYEGTIPKNIPTPYHDPHQHQQDLELRTELYTALSNERNLLQALSEDKRDKKRLEYLTERIEKLDKYFHATAVLDATFG